MKGLKVVTEMGFLLNVCYIFVTFGALLALGMPTQYTYVNVIDFLWLSGGIIGISLACGMASSIIIPGIGALACSGAIAIWGGVGIWNYIIVTNYVIKLFILTPIATGIIYIVAKQIRGN